jgi:hypothetical protein
MDDSRPTSPANIDDADGMDLLSPERDDPANPEQSQSVIPSSLLANIDDTDRMDLLSPERDDLANPEQSQSIISSSLSTPNEPSLRLNSLVLATFPWFSGMIMTPTALTDIFTSIHYARVYYAFFLAGTPR